MLTGRSHLPRVRTPEASHGRSLFPRLDENAILLVLKTVPLCVGVFVM